MDKEQKAKEYDEKNFDEKSDQGKRHWALKGFKAGFEAGKQERDREIIEKLIGIEEKNRATGEYWWQQRFTIHQLTEIIENLSK
jgi:hypothetical protein